MLIRLYSVYDRVARIYAEPFVSVNDATAARSFTLAQASPESMLFAAPQDYQLWYIGSMDNSDGSLVCSDVFEAYKVADGQPREVTEHE